MARFISIVSKEAGTGKTTVALNLALALHKLKKKTLVFDADFSKPNLLEHLNVETLPITLEDVFSGKNHITDSIYKHASGLKIIPSMSVHDYAKLQYHLQDLLADYDFIILDTPTDLTAMEEVVKNSQEAIIVHSPEFSSKIILDVSKILTRNKIHILGIVLNRSHSGGVDSIFQIPVIAKVPHHENITKSFIEKHPVMHSYPLSKPSKEFMMLAKKLVE